jgi:excisionase family DNA binding protein
MTQGEAAALLGVSRNTVVRLVERGVIPKISIAPGMIPRIRREDVIALVERPDEDSS